MLLLQPLDLLLCTKMDVGEQEVFSLLKARLKQGKLKNDLCACSFYCASFTRTFPKPDMGSHFNKPSFLILGQNLVQWPSDDQEVRG